MTTAPKIKPQTLGALVSHPLRVKCLIRFSDDAASPVQLAREFNEDLGNVYYHVDKLLKAGIIELVDSRPVNGSTEHFYRAIQPAEVNEAENAVFTPEERLAWSRPIVQLSMADASLAIDEGTFAEKANHVAIRYPATVDAEGFQELNEIYSDALERAMEVEARSAERRSQNGSQGFSARVVSLVFPMPEK